MQLLFEQLWFPTLVCVCSPFLATTDPLVSQGLSSHIFCSSPDIFLLLTTSIISVTANPISQVGQPFYVKVEVWFTPKTRVNVPNPLPCCRLIPL